MRKNNAYISVVPAHTLYTLIVGKRLVITNNVTPFKTKEARRTEKKCFVGVSLVFVLDVVYCNGLLSRRSWVRAPTLSFVKPCEYRTSVFFCNRKEIFLTLGKRLVSYSRKCNRSGMP